MNLNNKWFQLIKSNIKLIEIRINDEKRQKLLVNDIIVFKNKDTEEELKRSIKLLKLFDNFRIALENNNISKILPEVNSIEEGIKIYKNIPGYKDKEEVYGVLLIYLNI